MDLSATERIEQEVLDRAWSQANEPADSWSPVNLASLPEAPPIEPDLAGIGLLYPGKRHVFSGPPESAKTLAAYCMLIRVARVDESAVALLIDFEMGAYDARQRLRELGVSESELPRILFIEPDEPATDERLDRLVTLKPALVVVDAAAGAYDLEGLDDNKRGDVERISRMYVGAFWRNGIATILIDHVVKDADARGRFVIGSERKLGAADVHFGFETVKPISRGSSGHYKVITHKDRNGYHPRGHLCDLLLDSDPDTNEIEWRVTDPESAINEAGQFRPTHLMDRASRYLEGQFDAVTRNTVYADALGGKGSARTAALDALVREEYVSETTGSNNSKLLVSVRPYREDNPVDNPPPTSSGAVVREWCTSGASTSLVSGGAVVLAPTGAAPLSTSHDATEKPAGSANESGWFNDDGELVDKATDDDVPATGVWDADIPF